LQQNFNTLKQSLQEKAQQWEATHKQLTTTILELKTENAKYQRDITSLQTQLDDMTNAGNDAIFELKNQLSNQQEDNEIQRSRFQTEDVPVKFRTYTKDVIERTLGANTLANSFALEAVNEQESTDVEPITNNDDNNIQPLITNNDDNNIQTLIGDYQNDINELKLQVDKLTNDLQESENLKNKYVQENHSFKEQNTQLSNEIKQLNETITRYTNDITQLKQEINNINKKNSSDIQK